MNETILKLLEEIPEELYPVIEGFLEGLIPED